MNGIMQGFYVFSEEVMKFVGSNLLWIIFNLPIITIGLQLFEVGNSEELIPLIVLLLLLFPFVFFPSTSALFGVVRKFKLKEDVPIIKTFWKKYKENYVKSIFGGICIMLILSILLVDYFYLISITNISFNVLLIILSTVLLVFTLNFFSLIVHVDLKTTALLKQAFLFTFANPLHTLRIAVFGFITIYTSFEIFPFLVPLVMGSIIAFDAFHVFLIRHSKIRSQNEVSA